MTRYKKKMLILAMALIVCAVSILPWTQVAYATPDAEPTKTTIADKLILRLGPNWAGVEFELSTDMGKYPGAIIVGDNGVLTLELADSSTYTLSCLNSRRRPNQSCRSRMCKQPSPQRALYMLLRIWCSRASLHRQIKMNSTRPLI